MVGYLNKPGKDPFLEISNQSQPTDLLGTAAAAVPLFLSHPTKISGHACGCHLIPASSGLQVHLCLGLIVTSLQRHQGLGLFMVGKHYQGQDRGDRNCAAMGFPFGRQDKANDEPLSLKLRQSACC